jgi:hypothetical protein
VGDKSREIPVMREFLKDTGLEKAKISLDAHHCNPEIMAQIAQADGLFLIQVKEIQPKLLEHCRALAVQPALAETIGHDLIHKYQQRVCIIRSYLVQFENLQTIGRNGLHRYNNTDHSMLTGLCAARNVLDEPPLDVWSVNTEARYHEEGAAESSATTLDRLTPHHRVEK